MNYFKQVDLKKLFQFVRLLSEEDVETVRIMQGCNSVSIHVRRGDYCGTGYELCGIEY